MKPLQQKDFSMLIIEDLGILTQGNGTGRFALFECGICANPIRVRVATAKKRNQKICYSCQKIEQREIARQRFTIHGRSGTRIHNIWKNMNNRCKNVNDANYSSYGGRGITVHKAWEDVLIFETWALDNGYVDTLTIDRIDNDKGYFPENCRWVSMEIQSNNRRQKRGSSSKYIGVSRTKYNTWKATITIDKKRVHLGTFKTEEEAKEVREAHNKFRRK